MATAQRVVVGVAVIATLAIVALYLAIIRSQGGPSTPDVLTVPFVAGYLLLMAVLLGVSLPAPAGTRPAFRSAAAGGLFVLGVLALFTIGVAILLVAGLAIAATVLAIAARPGARSVVSAVLAGVLAVAVLVAGFEFSWHYLVCPSTGESGGTTASLLGNGSSYDCNDGLLIVH